MSLKLTLKPKKENRGKNRITHGMSDTPTYRVWRSMKTRCDNPNCKEYPYYGGRGIKYCDKWANFEGFLEDIGVIPTGQTLDRKDNDGNYCKDNCRLVPRSVQANNKSNNRLITYAGRTKTLAEWSEELDLPYPMLLQRIIRLGWDPVRAISTPHRDKR